MFYSLNENVNESVEDIMKNDEIVASPYEDFAEGAMAIVAESEMEFNNLMEYIGVNEAAQFAETGEPVVYTEASFSGIKAKIMSFIDKIINKIKSLFKRIVLFFDQKFKSDKEFVKKYRKRIEAASTKDIEFEGYTFPNFNTITSEIKISDVETALNTACTKETKEEGKDYLCNAILSGSESSDFAQKLFEKLHGGEEGKHAITINDSSLKQVLSDLENSSKSGKAAKDAHDAAIKALNKLKTSLPKDDISKYTDTKKQQHTMKIALIKDAANLVATAYGAIVKAIKDKNAQDRALCAKVLVKGKTLTRESATIEHPAYEGFFDGFDMI